MTIKSLVFLICCEFLSCQSQKAIQRKAVSVEEILFGGKGCRADSDCESNNCSMGICLGLLMTAVEVKREKVIERLKVVIEDEDVRREAFLALHSVISSEDNDVFLRCRAAHALSVFPKEMATPVLEGLIKSEEPALRFYGARSLAYLCEQEGFETLHTFLSHPSPAVQQLASIALSDARAHCGKE